MGLQGDFDILQPLVWLVDDRTPEVMRAAVVLLAHCIEAGATSGSAVAQDCEVQAALSTEGENFNVNTLSTYPGADLQEEEQVDETTEKVKWRPGYELAILRLVHLMSDNDDEIRSCVAPAMFSVIKAGNLAFSICDETMRTRTRRDSNERFYEVRLRVHACSMPPV